MVIFVIWLAKLYSGLLVNWDNQGGEVSVSSCTQLVENFPALEPETLPDSGAVFLCNSVALEHPGLKDRADVSHPCYTRCLTRCLSVLCFPALTSTCSVCLGGGAREEEAVYILDLRTFIQKSNFDYISRRGMSSSSILHFSSSHHLKAL